MDSTGQTGPTPIFGVFKNSQQKVAKIAKVVDHGAPEFFTAEDLTYQAAQPGSAVIVLPAVALLAGGSATAVRTGEVIDEEKYIH